MNRHSMTHIFLVAVTLLSLLLAGCAADSGHEIVVIKKDTPPVVYFRTMITAGSAFDPGDKPGLAYFTAKLLDKGTKTFSRQDIEERLAQIGAEIRISVDKEVVVISGQTLKENVGDFYTIYREIIREPIFPDEEVTRQRAEQLDRLNRIREDDAELSLAVLETQLFEGHRYGHLVEGTSSAVTGFTRDDVVDFYESYYLRGNTYAGIAGAVDDTIVARFRTDIKRLPAGKVVRSDRLAQNPRERRVILVEKDGRTQSHLRIGHLLEVIRGDEGYYALRILGSYLGQHREMFGQLFRNVRSQRGLSYGAYAYVEYFDQAGWSKLPGPGIPRNDQYFHMWTYPKEVNFEFCIKMLIDEMSQLIAEPIPAEDVERIKAFLANHFAFEVETPEAQLGMALDEQWYGLPQYVETFREKIEAVPRTELQSLALDHLHPAQTLIVAIVSDGTRAKSELLTRSTDLELPSGADEGTLEAENDRIKAIDLGLEAEDITILRGEDLFK